MRSGRERYASDFPKRSIWRSVCDDSIGLPRKQPRGSFRAVAPSSLRERAPFDATAFAGLLRAIGKITLEMACHDLVPKRADSTDTNRPDHSLSFPSVKSVVKGPCGQAGSRSSRLNLLARWEPCGDEGVWYSRPELNRDQRFRKPLLYPFELREQ